MVVEVEGMVINPDRPPFDRDPLQLLTIARDLMEDRCGRPPEGLHIDTSVGCAHRASLENLGGGNMHMHAPLLEYEKGVILRG